MRKLFKIFILGTIVLSASSCKKYLDINENPNKATTNTPDLVMPQALATTANVMVSYNIQGAWEGGYQANAGGVGGWGTVWSYNYTTATNTGLWTGVYDNANDYQYIIDNTSTTDNSAYFNAAARIMKSFLFIKLVDQYGNVPYVEALKGPLAITPKYDKDSDIYKLVYDELTAAIATIDANAASTSVKNIGDIMFTGDMTKWRAFANTLRLKILVRSKGTVIDSFVTGKTLTGGFLTDDAMVNPGYSAVAGQTNNMFANFAFTATSAAGGLGGQEIPTPWILSFYNGIKLSDGKRGAAIYKNFAAGTTAKNQLGVDVEPIDRSPGFGSAWFSGTALTGAAASASTGIGVLKGINAGVPLILAAESYFLQAEANLNGIGGVTTAYTTSFNAGIVASFNYLYKNAAGVVTGTPATDAASYQAINSGPLGYLANINIAATPAQRLEAIITQKYIAVNFINSEEGYADFRRTGYPAIVNGSTANTLSFASTKSQSTRADKLPVRQQYPASEYQLNSNNVPTVNQFTDKVFWDLN
jgi:hypothetical protein